MVPRGAVVDEGGAHCLACMWCGFLPELGAPTVCHERLRRAGFVPAVFNIYSDGIGCVCVFYSRGGSGPGRKECVWLSHSAVTLIGVAMCRGWHVMVATIIFFYSSVIFHVCALYIGVGSGGEGAHRVVDPKDVAMCRGGHV